MTLGGRLESMINTGRPLRLAVLLSSLTYCPILGFASRPSTIESPNLRVEVTANPYSFRIIEKSSGQVLVSQKGTYIGEDHLQAKQAKGLKREANQLQGTLTFSPTTDTARITFSFASPEIVRISLNSADANAKEIAEEFADQGEHYYGIWESPFGGNIDNRGADHDFRGIQHQTDENFSSARAPF